MLKDEIVALLEMLIGAYPETFIKDANATVEIWNLSFSEEDAETIYKAARVYMLKGKKFPSPADIRACIKNIGIYDTPATPAIPSKVNDSIYDENVNTGCDICPFADTDWVDSPNGCHREKCIC